MRTPQLLLLYKSCDMSLHTQPLMSILSSRKQPALSLLSPSSVGSFGSPGHAFHYSVTGIRPSRHPTSPHAPHRWWPCRVWALVGILAVNLMTNSEYMLAAGDRKQVDNQSNPHLTVLRKTSPVATPVCQSPTSQRAQASRVCMDRSAPGWTTTGSSMTATARTRARPSSTAASHYPALNAGNVKSKLDTRPSSPQPTCLLKSTQCDRTRPCSACCARGIPKECVFTLHESEDFRPIQQGAELRRLRAECQRLKKLLLDAKLAPDEDIDHDANARKQPATTLRSILKKLSLGQSDDSIYFGSPSIASVYEEVTVVYPQDEDLADSIPS